jgi:hypothetical protein
MTAARAAQTGRIKRADIGHSPFGVDSCSTARKSCYIAKIETASEVVGKCQQLAWKFMCGNNDVCITIIF